MSDILRANSYDSYQEKQFLIRDIIDTAHKLERVSQPNEVVLEANGIVIANNHQYPNRAIRIGENYGFLDAIVRMSGGSCDEPRAEGARFTLNHYDLPLSTSIELMDHDPGIALGEVPFAVTPSGCANPTSKLTLRELLHVLDELVQKQPLNILEILDPRLEGISLARSLHYIMQSIIVSAKKTKSKRVFSAFEPLILGGDMPITERLLTLDILRQNSKLTLMALRNVVRQSSVEYSGMDYGLEIVFNPQNGHSAIRALRGRAHTAKGSLPIESTDQVDPKDAMQYLRDALTAIQQSHDLSL